MAVYYLWDEMLRIEKNKRGENHWFGYITEIFTRLGIGGEAICAKEAKIAGLGCGDVLFVGADELSPPVVSAIGEALRQGMTLVGFGTAGADELFGIKKTGELAQPEGEYSPNGYFQVREKFQGDYLPVPETAPRLPVFSPVGICEAAGAEILADILAEERMLPAFFKHGNAYYFSFDLAQTLWKSAQGKPACKSERGLSFLRISDARITPLDYDTTIAYGDYYLYILQAVLVASNSKQPMLHRLPPAADGSVPDLLLFYAGDEDATPHISTRASEIMHERGLPYHINLMPVGEGMDFVTTPQEYEAIKNRGHELALHYDMTGCEFSEENFKKQYKAYLRTYGETSVSVVGHCLAHKGWARRGRYLERLGIMGDSCRCAEYAEDINAFNLYGFAFGTAYPIFLHEDSSHQNRRLDFADLPIAYYEPRIGGGYVDGEAKIHKCLDDAAYFGRMINLFTHPHYVADNYGYDNKITLAALDEAIRYTKEKGWNVVHATPDKVCRFWHGRSRSKITNCLQTDRGMSCRVECCSQDGLIVRFPGDKAAAASVDGARMAAATKSIDGRLWLLVPVLGLGGHIVNVECQ